MQHLNKYHLLSEMLPKGKICLRNFQKASRRFKFTTELIQRFECRKNVFGLEMLVTVSGSPQFDKSFCISLIRQQYSGKPCNYSMTPCRSRRKQGYGRATGVTCHETFIIDHVHISSASPREFCRDDSYKFHGVLEQRSTGGTRTRNY